MTTHTNTQPIDILAISPHPDDAEAGCGGILLLSKQHGHTSGILYMTAGEMGTSGTATIRKKEIELAAKHLQLDYSHIANFKDCQITDSFENRLILAQYIRHLRPKVLLLPYWEGIPGKGQGHTDHIETSIMASHAVNFARLHKMPLEKTPYEVPQVLYYLFPRTITPTFVIDISQVAQQWKQALEAHHSQIFGQHGQKIRFYEMILAYHKDLGFHIGAEYAQGLLSTRPIQIETPFQFLKKKNS